MARQIRRTISLNGSSHMAKGQQRSNREKKKPKQPKKPVAPVAPGRVPWK